MKKFKTGDYVIRNGWLGVVSSDSVGNATTVMYLPFTDKVVWTSNDELVKLKNDHSLNDLQLYQIMVTRPQNVELEIEYDDNVMEYLKKEK